MVPYFCQTLSWMLWTWKQIKKSTLYSKGPQSLWRKKWSEVNWKSLSRVRLFATPWTYSPWNSPGQNTGVGGLSLLQGIFPTQGSNPGLPHCTWILYELSHQGTPPMKGGSPNNWKPVWKKPSMKGGSQIIRSQWWWIPIGEKKQRKKCLGLFRGSFLK